MGVPLGKTSAGEMERCPDSGCPNRTAPASVNQQKKSGDENGGRLAAV